MRENKLFLIQITFIFHLLKISNYNLWKTLKDIIALGLFWLLAVLKF